MTLRWLALALALVVAAPPAHAQGDKKAAAKKKADKKDKDKDKADTESDDSSDSSDDSGDSDDDNPKAKAKGKKADKEDKEDKADKADKNDDGGDTGGDDEEGAPSGKGRDKANTGSAAAEPVKQDLNGHDLGTKKKANEFERDRFFVDKADTEATENGTLIQGSVTSSSFLYSESGSDYKAEPMGTPNAFTQAGVHRLFTDLRLQTDFRHIKGSRWEARVDGRVRFVNTGDPENEVGGVTTQPSPTYIQSGLTGQNEYEIRELWLVRNGERTDVTFGRQFIADLAAVKIDGLRVDYASSQRLTFLGFGGLYPLRGSRSITTDYIDIKDPATGMSASKYVGTGGFGAAYRTPTTYGSFGGVVLVPTASGAVQEQPRVFATANGYWRPNPKVDIYHFALLDLVSSYGAQITNLSGGLNYKPTQRLRMTASYNRVDTDTLNIQALAFLDAPTSNPVVQNEIALQRLATNQARGSISAGLGNLERFEITTAMAYRSRRSITLQPIGTDPAITLAAAKSVEVYGSIVDRRSFKDARIGIDAVQTFGVGTLAYQRDEVFALRGFVGRELDSGKGEWEAEIAYAENKEVGSSLNCMGVAPKLADCYGFTTGSVVSGGGTLYYRFNRDWFMIAQAYLSRTTLTSGMGPADPTITGLTGYARFAYRF